MNLTMNAAPSVSRTPAPADAAVTLETAVPADLLALLLPFPQVIAADAALPEVAAAAPQDLPEALPPADTDAVADQAPDNLLAAMALPIPAAALPAMMLAMPAPKPAAASTPLASGTTAEAAPVAAPALRALPELAPVAATPLPARTDSGAAKATIALDSAQLDTVTPDTAPDQASTGIAAGAVQPAAARAADKLQLAGPPAAWRQTLHEALGERLQLQLGRGSEQATIRLEPPMLGRIDIAIRHSGGNLEVHIAASNGEVLRQLNAVSDSLRGDLSGRQYASVSVNVSGTGSEIPRTHASAQAGGQPMSGQPDAQGRRSGGEQQQEQQRTPGLALNDAGAAGSPFSLNGRQSGQDHGRQ